LAGEKRTPGNSVLANFGELRFYALR